MRVFGDVEEGHVWLNGETGEECDLVANGDGWSGDCAFPSQVCSEGITSLLPTGALQRDAGLGDASQQPAP